ncbi:MAG: acetylglutamate kinase [Thermoflavifilum sp.]|uniref:acetylglutamate kinase n=1 Tax=Thermoflavifilum sp. TaxID=1968839 RepID=UPI0018A57221|nr:acetylglutamate kinase [Thermoflavifilum sp.]QOR75915.1 MAG: acetylglutamate kinase [Thermoflavifilum sp.]
MTTLSRLYVVKIGGQVIDDPVACADFLHAFAALPGPKVLVHGGGKLATRIGEQLGVTSQYVQGRRITDEATLQLVTMVYGGLINKQLVARLQALGCPAIGLTGADMNLMRAVKRPVKETDYGWVGDLTAEGIRVEAFMRLVEAGEVPVLAPLTHDGNGHLLNTNADTIASCVAVALSAHYRVHLVFCFDQKGVLRHPHDPDSVIPLIRPADMPALMAEGALRDGILPKLENAFAACRAGVEQVLIGPAYALSALSTETSTRAFGTIIRL